MMFKFPEANKLVKAQYPHLGEGWAVQMQGWAIEEFTGSTHGIVEACNEGPIGIVAEQALTEALQASIIKVEAPEGYSFVRVVKEGKTPLLLLIKIA